MADTEKCNNKAVCQLLQRGRQGLDAEQAAVCPHDKTDGATMKNVIDTVALNRIY